MRNRKGVNPDGRGGGGGPEGVEGVETIIRVLYVKEKKLFSIKEKSKHITERSFSLNI